MIIQQVGGSRSWATFSEDRRYRFKLYRQWANPQSALFLQGAESPARRLITFVMLNPSTADGSSDDPTVRRCIAFAKAWGFDGLYVVNQFALVSIDPQALREDPPLARGGNRNKEAILDCATESAMVLAAWGDKPRLWQLSTIDLRSRQMLGPAGVHVLGLTQGGSPKHPLYVHGDTKPQLWADAAVERQLAHREKLHRGR